jgi:hypothetical protein
VSAFVSRVFTRSGAKQSNRIVIVASGKGLLGAMTRVTKVEVGTKA